MKNLTKENLELMSYTDITNILLEEGKQQSTAELFKRIVELLEMPKSAYENKIGDYYTSLTTDKRFILLPDGNWDLKVNHPTNLYVLDEDDETEEFETEELDELELEDAEITEKIYEEDPEDDNGDPTEEYKNLVIIDEEDLNNEN